MARTVLTFPTASTTAIALAQTTAGAGALQLTGTLRDLTALTYGVQQVVLPNIERTVSLTVSGADLSAANITIVGTSLLGSAVTETRAGPNNTTVFTTAKYHTITSVTTDAALGTAMSVGTGTTGNTTWVKADQYQDPVNIAIGLAITATASWTVQYTYDDVETVASPVTYSPAGLTAQTTTIDGGISLPILALRGVLNSSSGSGAVTMTTMQATGGTP